VATFVDTNVFLRHVLNDDPRKSPACLALLQSIEQGRVDGWTSELVISEVVFVLGNKRSYDFGREVIRDALLPLIELSALKVPNRRLYRRVFELYTSLPIDYVGAYHVALMESRGETELYSYDADFDRVPSLRRLEP
jgi:predicted nucleic acid-binding protein